MLLAQTEVLDHSRLDPSSVGLYPSPHEYRGFSCTHLLIDAITHKGLIDLLGHLTSDGGANSPQLGCSCGATLGMFNGELLANCDETHDGANDIPVDDPEMKPIDKVAACSQGQELI